jgi:hypothetical protein
MYKSLQAKLKTFHKVCNKPSELLLLHFIEKTSILF